MQLSIKIFYNTCYKIVISINNWINNFKSNIFHEYIYHHEINIVSSIISPNLSQRLFPISFAWNHIQHRLSDLPRPCRNGSLPRIFPATGKDHKREPEPGRQSWPLLVHVRDRGWYRANGDRKSKVCRHAVRNSADPRLRAVQRPGWHTDSD